MAKLLKFETITVGDRFTSLLRRELSEAVAELHPCKSTSARERIVSRMLREIPFDDAEAIVGAALQRQPIGQLA